MMETKYNSKRSFVLLFHVGQNKILGKDIKEGI